MKTDKNTGLIFISIFVVIALIIGCLIIIFGKTDSKNSNSSNSSSSNSSTSPTASKVASFPNCDSIQYTKPTSDPIAKVSTEKGCIVLELYVADAPKTVQNFIQHSNDGYYNNTIFHRLVKDFVIQGGDPKGDGSGGESIYGTKFADELNPNTQSYKTGYVKGVLAMANAGPNTNGSQFFITVGDLTTSLTKNYTIFGKVLAGQDLADAISKGETVANAGGEQSKPVNPIKITKIEIVN